MSIKTTIGPYRSNDINSSYDMANALNQLYYRAGTGSGDPSGPPIIITGTGDPQLTAVQLMSASFSGLPPNAVRTTGYYVPGDWGDGLYVRKEVEPTYPGYITTQDRYFYQLVPENGQIKLDNFGVKKMTGANINDIIPDGDPYDCYPAWKNADKYIKETGIDLTLRLGGGVFFFSRPIHLRRCAYVIKGMGTNGTYIRTPPYGDGIIICYTWSLGHDWSLFGGGAFAKVGQGFWTAANGNCYRVVTAGNLGVDYPTDLATANNPATTYNTGTAQVRFEKNVGPGSFEDLYFQYGDFSQGGGSRIEDIHIYCQWDARSSDPRYNKFPDENLDVSGTPIYPAQICMRATATVRNVRISGSGGHGIACIANGDPEIQGAGNVNGWDLQHIKAYYCAKDGIHVGYSDANAGSVRYVDTYENGRAGISDWGFLGNNYSHCQEAFSGFYTNPRFGVTNTQYPYVCLYNGWLWIMRLSSQGSGELYTTGLNEEPGVRLERPPDGYIIAWTGYGGTGSDGIDAVVTGSISGTTLTVTAIASGAISAGNMIATPQDIEGKQIAGPRVVAGTMIVNQLSGSTGSTGTYTVSISQTYSSGAINVMTAQKPIGTFTGSISGNTLTVTAIASGVVGSDTVWQQILGAGIIPGTLITGQITGTAHGLGTYSLSRNYATPIASETMRSANISNLPAPGNPGFPDWTPQQKFEASYAFGGNNANAGNIFEGMYIEGGSGPAQPGPRDVVIGGPYTALDEKVPFMVKFADGSLSKAVVGNGRNIAGTGYNRYSAIGGFSDGVNGIGANVLYAQAYDGREFSLCWHGGTGLGGVTDQEFGLIKTGDNQPRLVSLATSAQNAFGRVAGNFESGLALYADRFVLGNEGKPDSAFPYDGRHQFYTTGDPTTVHVRSHAQGEIGWNIAGVSGQPLGWYCTAAGTPGTWVALANIP